jgi:hypothetical protein
MRRPVSGRDPPVGKEDNEGMTTSVDSSLDQQAAPMGQPHKRSAGHIVAIVIGCFMLLPGLSLVVGGGAIALAQAVATDDDGYFTFTLDRVESDGVAVATTDLWLDDVEGDASPWMLDWLDLDLRLRVDGAATTDDVFVGIARTSDVERYLSRAAYSEIVRLDEHTPAYRHVAGISRVLPPLDRDFWTVSASGTGEQELTWNARGGRWSVVVMNTDGSPVVAADVEVGARSGAVTPIAITLLVVGGIITAAAVALIVVGARGRRTPGTSARGQFAGTTPFPPPTPETAALLDDEQHHPTPVG